MKKLLALVLALVMVMGLATVGTNAAVKYTDEDDFNFEEAIDVMSAVGVLEGFEGQFRPTVELKRSEAAKIVAYLNTNNKTAEGLVGTGKWSDVPTNHWAAGYVDYLTSVGVLAGRSDTVFDPDGDLTAIDFAKMLLVVIGFDPTIEGLVGSDYKINTSKLATDAGLFKGLSDLAPNDVLTREQAAQMAFNTVKAATVEYANKGGSISVNGADIAFGASTFNYVTTTIAKEQSISKRTLTNTGNNTTQSGYTVEFGERQYPDLKVEKTIDDFGRPVNDWSYGKEQVGVYIDQDDLLGYYTTAVTGSDLVELIGEAKIKNTEKEDVRYYVNGTRIEYEPMADLLSTGTTLKAGKFAYQALGVGKDTMIRSNKVPYGFTGNGVLTQVFERDEVFYITSILTYYVQAKEDFNTVSGKITYELFTADPKAGFTGNANGKATGFIAPQFDNVTGVNTTLADNGRLSAEDFPEIKTLKKGDGFLARFFYNGSRWEVGEIVTTAPEVKETQTITKFSVSTDGRSNNTTDANNLTVAFYNGYVIAGSQYDFSRAVFLDNILRDYDNEKTALDKTYDLVLDPYGYLIAAFVNSVSDQYLFLAGLSSGSDNLATSEATGFAIFSDGTSSNIKINLLKTNSNIAEYNDDRNKPQHKGANGDNYLVVYDTLDNNHGHAYNRWFTYSVSGEGSSAVYTLKPVPKSQIATNYGTAGGSAPYSQNWQKNASLANDGKQLRISSAQPRLIGDYYSIRGDMTTHKLLGSYISGTDLQSTTAWFNESSTIITVTTGKTSANVANLTVKNAAYNRSIAEVTGIYKGIQNVDVVAYPYAANDADLSKDPSGATVKESALKEENPFTGSVFTVYDSNRYIKYAIVVGTNNGGSDSYMYAVTGAKSESKVGSYYYWDFTAVLDGELKDLTVKTEDYNVITTIKNSIGFDKPHTSPKHGNALFKATFDADGYVKSVSGPVAIFTNAESNDTIYNNFEKFNHTGFKTTNVVYNTYFGADDILYCNGQTLYNKFNGSTDYASASDIGLTIAGDAKIFVVQQYLVQETQQTTTVVDIASSFDAALGYIWGQGSGETANSQRNSRTDLKDFNGYIAAGLGKSGGPAQWVVIKTFSTVNVDYSKPTTSAGGTDLTAKALSKTIAIYTRGTDTFDVKDIQSWEVWGAASGVENAKYTRVANGVGYTTLSDTITATTNNPLIFGDTVAGTPKAHIGVGLSTTMTYYVVIMTTDGKVWTSNSVTPLG